MCRIQTGVVYNEGWVNTMCLGGIICVHIENSKDKTEPCGTPACITLGVDISPSTETLNFLCEKRANKLIKLVENSNLDNLYSKPEC
jgi:hypothetical protein